MSDFAVKPTSQPSLRRMRDFAVKPNRDLGQNFLIDSNLLPPIAREARLSDDDVVLEIGGGLGVLSEFLAPQLAHLHVIEIDRRLHAPLTEALSPFSNATIHWGDAMRIGLDRLSPPPTKLVANLPYGIAASALLLTIEKLPTISLWLAMVQREVGQRLASPPGSGEYGVSSVIAQLSCDVQVVRAVPRTVFHPAPNVDSVLIRMTRTGPSATPTLRSFVKAAFAHRRKALARSVSLSLQPSDPDLRRRIQDALQEIGHPPDVRAERLSPEELRRLEGLLR